MRITVFTALLYLAVALVAGYIYLNTSTTVNLEPVECSGRTYLLDPQGLILEYEADITVSSGGNKSSAKIVYQVAITGDPCQDLIPVYTPILDVEGDTRLSSLLLNTGLIAPQTIRSPGAVDPAQFIYILPEESLLALRIQGGEQVGPGVGAGEKVWPGLTLLQEGRAIVRGQELASVTKVTIDEDTGVLEELVIASKTPGQAASIEVSLKTMYLPTGAGDYVEAGRLHIALLMPALIAGFALSLSAYTIARRE